MHRWLHMVMQARLWQKMIPATWLAGATVAVLPSFAYGQVTTAGDGTGTRVFRNGNQFNIFRGTQSGTNLFHNFDSLNIESNQTVNFLPDSDVLNIVSQVSGGEPTYIEGQISVQGSDANLYLINPSGVLFGPDARISLSGSFAATTADQIGFGDSQRGSVLWLDALQSGRDYTDLTAAPSAFRFTAESASAVVNQGDLSVSSGESLTLIGGNVLSEGHLAAPGGEVGLVSVGGNSTVRFGVPGSLLSLEVAEQDFGTDVGRPFMPTDLPTLLTGESGAGTDAAATELVVASGNLVLLTGTSVDSEEVAVTGSISTHSAQAEGGVISLVGRSIDVLSATLDASGDSDGGIVRIGNDTLSESLPASELVLLRDSPIIRAQGLHGAGGKIAVGAADISIETGNISAQGQIQGGLIETSATRNVKIAGGTTIDASGPSGGVSGRGLWRLNSAGIVITDDVSSLKRAAPSVIETALDSSTDIDIDASGRDITLSRSINQAGRSEANLTLSGRRFIETNNSTINLESTGQLAFDISPVNSLGDNSVHAAIAAIGDVKGARLLRLSAANYEFSETAVIDSDIEIVGATDGRTILSAAKDIRVFEVASGTVASLENLTLTTSDSLAESDLGGGIVNAGTLTINNSRFKHNRGDLGGAIHTQSGGSLTVSNSIFTDNSVTLDGGAIAHFNSDTLSILNTEFNRNSSQNNGGAIKIVDSGATNLSKATFTGNTTHDDGGALHSEGTDITVLNTTFTNNISTDDGGGAAIRGLGQTTFNKVTFEGNNANDGGAFVGWDGANATFNETTFDGNTATGEGGGLSLVSGTYTLNMSTVENNTSNSIGGGLSAYESSLDIDGLTVQRNTSGGSGGGLHLSSGSTANVTGATTFTSNESSQGGGIYADESTVSIFPGSVFTTNKSTNGGGILVVDGALSVERAAFDGNIVTRGGGGGIRSVNSDVVLTDAAFTGNSAGGGGGLDLRAGSRATIKGTTFDSNTASFNGGGVHAGEDVALDISDTAFSNNGATGSGGGLYAANNSSADIYGDTLFAENQAGDSGGGIATRNAASLMIEKSFLGENSAGADGGGLSLSSNSVVDIRSTGIVGNEAIGRGGAVSVGGRTQLSLDNVTLDTNTAGNSGGAIYQMDTSDVSAVRASLRGNTAGVNGGAIANESTDGQLSVSLAGLSNNSAGNSGGAIYTTASGKVVLSDTGLTNNTAEIGDGGALYVGDRADLRVREVDLSNNVALSRGGALFNAGKASLSSLALVENRAIAGGAVANTGTLEAINVTLSGNQASDEGGAIKTAGETAALALSNTTIANNRAGSGGGGIHESETQSTRLLNTIVANNQSAVAADVSGRFIDEGNNLIGQSDGSTGFTRSLLVGAATNPLDPKLDPLTANQGATRTHLLQAGSPAINAGIRDRLPLTDQRALSRIVGAAVDIGAVEVTAEEIPFDLVETVSPNQPAFVISATPIPSIAALPAAVQTSALRVISQLGTSPTDKPEDKDLLPSMTVEAKERPDNAAIREVERTFSQGYQDYWNLPIGGDLSFQQVQAVLRRAQNEHQVNSAVVYARFMPTEALAEVREDILGAEAIRSDSDLLQLLLITPKGELVTHQLPVTRKEADRQVRLLRSNVSDPEDSFGYRPLAQQLYQWLLAPLEEALAAQDIQNLLYSLDEGLRTAPIAAMRDNMGYALERYGLSTVPTVGLTQADFSARVRRSTVAMGVSEFDQQMPLPAVPIELDFVENFMPAAKTILNEDATVTALKTVQALEQPGVLHLATHADFDSRSPETSSIHLWHNPLSMAEFKALDWASSDLELLILSACVTALSSPNSELGFAGLAAAAGVDATVGSLWQVSDTGTLALMSEFYIQLENTDLRFEALRRAQLSLLKGDTRIQNGNLLTSQGEIDLPDEWNLPEHVTLDHPFFWSAFTMVGNPW